MPDESDGPPECRDDQNGGGRAERPHGAEAETRNREEYYAALRVAVSTEESVTARRITAEEQAAAENWDETAQEFRCMWSEYQRRWPPDERAPAGESADRPGSWRGEGERFLEGNWSGSVNRGVIFASAGLVRR